MFCNKCGNKIKEGSSFCNKCGSIVKKEEEVKQEIIYQEVREKEPIVKTPIIIALTLGFLVISISLVGIISYFTSNLNVI